jgi:ribosomal protein S8
MCKRINYVILVFGICFYDTLVSGQMQFLKQSTTGFFVLSTSYGIITEMDARRYNVGGCILFGIT